MMTILRAFCLFIALLGVGFPVWADTASNSDAGLRRLTLRQDLLGFEAVGRLDFATGGFCTGVLVASDLVLTAGHCLRDAARLGHVDGTRFRAGLRDGEAMLRDPALAGTRAHG